MRSTHTARQTVRFSHWGEPIEVELGEAAYRAYERRATTLGMPVTKLIQRDLRPVVLDLKRARRSRKEG
jgi:hypothetical protein